MKKVNFDQLSDAFKDLFRREWYTNQGPLTQGLERTLTGSHGYKHTVCMTNKKIAQLITGKALGLEFNIHNAFTDDFVPNAIKEVDDLHIIGFGDNGINGAAVFTNDDSLAARLRNIRSSYGSGPKVYSPFL